MKEFDEVCKLMLTLIEEIKQDGDNLIFNDKAKLIVKEIADFARATNIYQREKEFSEQFWEENKDANTAENVYLFMLDRIANAPTSIHRNVSLLLHIPTLDEILNREYRR